MTWKEFLNAHWNVLAATDFFIVGVWTGSGLIRYHVRFVIQLATREVQIAELIPEPSEAWMLQLARKLIHPWTGFLRQSRLLNHDRWTLLSEQIRQVLRSTNFDPLRLLLRSSNLNAYAVRFVRTVPQGCLNRVVFLGEASLRRAVDAFVIHSNQERNYQGLANQLIQSGMNPLPAAGDICCRERHWGPPELLLTGGRRMNKSENLYKTVSVQ